MPRTIALLNMKGGVGKTTLAVNLAYHFFQNESKSVLLIDLDPQFNATQYVMDYKEFEKHRKDRGTIADLLIDQPTLQLHPKRTRRNPASTLHTVQKSSSARFDLLPAELNLGWVVKNPAQMEFRLEKLLASIRDDYAYVFIDCAPTDSVLTTMALTASEFVLVPVRPDRFSILGFVNVMNTIDDFRQNCNDVHSVKTLGVLFTQVMGNSTVETKCMSAVRSEAQKQGAYVFTSSLNYSTSFTRSVSEQTPIFRTAYAHQDVRSAAPRIADELTKRIESLTTQ